jgi:hypothetical protein
VGSTVSIVNCNASNLVFRANFVGGYIAATNLSQVLIQGCRTIQLMKGKMYVGGLVGSIMEMANVTILSTRATDNISHI